MTMKDLENVQKKMVIQVSKLTKRLLKKTWNSFVTVTEDFKGVKEGLEDNRNEDIVAYLLDFNMYHACIIL